MELKSIDDPSVWTSEELATDPSWIVTFDDLAREEVLRALQSVRSRGLGLGDIGRDDFPLPMAGPLLDGVIDQIEGGRGVILLRRVPIEGLSLEDAEALFWGLASHIGYPEPQESTGKRLHHVRAAQVFTDEASTRKAFETTTLRAYQTNVELGFHNDGSDVLLFLCLQNAQSGGLSRVVSVGQAFNALVATDPEAAAVLFEDFHFDGRGELTDGRRAQISPVLAARSGRLSILYKRGYIELADTIPGVPKMTMRQRQALDAFDAVLNDPAHVHSFMMRPGDIQIANNYSVLHSRTMFTEHPEPERKRTC